MTAVRRFLIVEAAWTAAILVLALPVTIAEGEPLSLATLVEWLARALGLALFPAAVAIGGDVLKAPDRWRVLAAAAGVAALLAAVTFVLAGWVGPALTEGQTLLDLRAQMTAGASWEAKNDAAWKFYGTFALPLRALLLAAIGAEIGIWARHAAPPALRRPLYWLVFLGLMVAGYGVSDSTYETVVLATAADADFAAAYPLLLPVGLCAGLFLPTLALLTGAGRERAP